MRRKEREISDVNEIARILSNCSTLRIAFPTSEEPYIVPVNYGFSLQNDRFALFFHSATKGRKVELIESSDARKIGWETDRTTGIGFENENQTAACSWSCRYESVVGTGVIARLKGREKIDGLNSIMEHYQFRGTPEYDAKILDKTNVYRIDVASISAKKN